MEERILKFIAALRAAGVRISLAESSDAFQAVKQLGVKDRTTFRLSLRSTLVKEAADLEKFEQFFEIFFGGAGTPPLQDLSNDLTPQEAQALAQAILAFNDQLRQAFERLMKGEPLSQAELERLARLVGLNQADQLRYHEWMTQRILRALHFPEVQQALRQLAETLSQLGVDKARAEQIQRLLQANQQALVDQIRQFVGERLLNNLSQRPPAEPGDNLLNRPFSLLSEKDMQKLRQEVRRLAAALKTRIALRQKRAHSGQLDAKATIRANLKHGAVPFEIKHRDHHLKPRLVILCDISTSMRHCSELMLSLLYHLQDLISKTHAFAFISHLEYISPDLEGRPVDQAVRQVMERLPSGYYNTDLGRSLENFRQSYLQTLDHRTTLIIVGDGRNNYNDPRLDILTDMRRRSRRLIWINPEAIGLWGTGDSDMLNYAPLCDTVLQAGTLGELTAAVDRLLTG